MNRLDHAITAMYPVSLGGPHRNVLRLPAMVGGMSLLLMVAACGSTSRPPHERTGTGADQRLVVRLDLQR